MNAAQPAAARVLYPSRDAALARVERLRPRGWWPGVAGPDRDGRYWVTSDPDQAPGGDR